jgi:SAM-dependent methyltransferase
MRLSKTAETALTVGRNVFLGGNLASLSLIVRPRELVRYVGESLLLYRSLTSQRGVPQKNVYEVLKPSGSIEEISLGNLEGDGAWFTPAPSYASDIVSLCLMCRILRPKTVFEIGTLTGYTALHFALNTEEGAQVYTLDLPKDTPVAPRLKTDMADDFGIRRHASARSYCFENVPAASKIQTLFGDSAQFDFTPFFGKVDLFFIDGAHSFDYVRNDTLNALKCCHPGSVIAWHDFGRVVVDGVARWVCEFARDHAVYSVPGGSLAFCVVA